MFMFSGLKPGQRKVLYTCFKRKQVKEIKVAQLAGSVAEHSAYHHGEVSASLPLLVSFCSILQHIICYYPTGKCSSLETKVK